LPGFWAKLVLLLGLGQQDAVLAQAAIFGVLLMAVVEAHYLFRLVGLLYAKTEHDAPPHRMGDLAVASLLGVVLLASMPLLPVLAESLGWMAHQASDIAAYRTVILGSEILGVAP
jgi:NADH:ubiquinone oxidoreductase subunit 2 (subunit N)